MLKNLPKDHLDAEPLKKAMSEVDSVLKNINKAIDAKKCANILDELGQIKTLKVRLSPI